VKRASSMLGAAVVLGMMMLSAVAMTNGATFKNARDPLGRFTISVPATWSVQTSTSPRAASVITQAPAKPGQLPDSVDVIVQDMPSALTAQTCVGEADTVMRFTIHKWTNVSQGKSTLGGLPAYTRVYNWQTSTGQQRQSIQSCATLGRRAFMVVGTTANTPISVRQNLPQLQQIMNTFRPLASAPPPAEPTGPGSSGSNKNK
jgi:hypothetical protein